MVCGASKGIGAATAKMMAKAGANVTVCARNEAALNELVEELATLGKGTHTALQLDLEDTENLTSAVHSLIESTGPVHILINNAGGPPGGPLMNNKVGDFEAPFRRHLHAAHTLVQALAPQMEEQGFGRIIQIISTSVKEPIPNIGLSNTLRGAMASWAKSLSNELHLGLGVCGKKPDAVRGLSRPSRAATDRARLKRGRLQNGKPFPRQ
jgi:3-oxoacyl-[acyl-carrier protein] reductase